MRKLFLFLATLLLLNSADIEEKITKKYNSDATDIYNLDEFDFYIDSQNHSSKLPKPEDYNSNYNSIVPPSRTLGAVNVLTYARYKNIIHSSVIRLNALEEKRFLNQKNLQHTVLKKCCN